MLPLPLPATVYFQHSSQNDPLRICKVVSLLWSKPFFGFPLSSVKTKALSIAFKTLHDLAPWNTLSPSLTIFLPTHSAPYFFLNTTAMHRPFLLLGIFLTLIFTWLTSLSPSSLSWIGTFSITFTLVILFCNTLSWSLNFLSPFPYSVILWITFHIYYLLTYHPGYFSFAHSEPFSTLLYALG